MKRFHREPSHPVYNKKNGQTIKLLFVARVLCFVAAILNLKRSRGLLVRLEVWDSQILGGSDRSPKIINRYFIKAPSRLRAISVISVPDLALADRAREVKIQNGRHKTQNTRDKGSLFFYLFSKRM